MRKIFEKTELELLGRNIRRLRKAAGLNQKALADMAGTRAGTISEIENNINKNPGWELIARIARVLKSTIKQLITDETSSITEEQFERLPPGLEVLVRDQEKLLLLSEDRITLEELNWLKRLPLSYRDEMTPDEFLVFLRHLRMYSEMRSIARDTSFGV